MSTSAPAMGLLSRFPPTRKNLGWAVLFLIGLAVFVFVDIPFMNPHHEIWGYFSQVRWVLFPHVVFGGFSILAGPVQFSTRVRRKYPKFHRILGRMYVVAVLIAAPMGILIPIVGPRDPFFTTGVIVHGSVWFIVTLMAFLTARNRNIVEHRQWMVRSYILTFSFVATRALAPIWGFFHINESQYGVVDVALNVVYLLVADIAMNWRQLTTKRA